jgi:hypothetical protein
MSATAVLERLESLGVIVTVDGEALELEPASKVPVDLVTEVHENLPEIIERLQRQLVPPSTHERLRCRACTCNDAIGGGDHCPACKGRGCRDCGGCLRASMLWRETERYAKYFDIPLHTVLNRLQKGSGWLQQQAQHNRDDNNLFMERFHTWAGLEEVLRAVHGYVGCIFGEGKRCPEDSPVTCSSCIQS